MPRDSLLSGRAQSRAGRTAPGSQPAQCDDLVRFERCVRRLVPDAAGDDLVQEAWLAHVYDGNVTNLEAFLSTVVPRLWRGRLRSERARRYRERCVARREAVRPECRVELADEYMRVRAAMRSLPLRYRQVIRMRFVDELTATEIASILGVPQGTVRTRLARGLRRLKVLLNVGPGEF